MSKSKSGKKVVVTAKRETPVPTVRRSKSPGTGTEQNMLIFNKSNYLLMGIGFLLVLIGMALMTGGKMPSPDVWDESLIYGFRRVTLAPIIILAGLVVEVYAIFKK